MEIITLDLQSIILIFLPTILVIVFAYLFWNFGKKRKSNKVLHSYSLRQNVLTKAEGNFYNVLWQVIGEDYVIFPKIRLADVFFTKNGQGYYSALNKITAKHVDFLLADPQDFSPVMAIELDDRSHQKQSRKERDEFVDQIFEKTGLPLMRVKTAKKYDSEEIRDRIVDGLKQRTA